MERRVTICAQPSAAEQSQSADIAPSTSAGDQGAHTTRKRVLAYDILRVFAAATVVTIHVFAAYISSVGPPPALSPVNIFDQGLHYAVPLFTFLSGALSWGAVWGAGQGRYARFLRRRWLVVGIPYLVWSILFFFLRPSAGYPPLGHDALAMAWQFVVLFVSGTTWYHLYFMPMILVLYLFTPLASRAVHKAPELFLGVFLLFVVYVVPLVMARYGGMAIHRRLDPMILPLVSNLVTYSPFMALGAWFSVRQDVVGRALRWLGAPLLALAAVLLVLNLGHPAPTDGRYLFSWVYIADMSLFVLGFLGVAYLLAERPVLTRDSVWADRLVTLASLTLGVYLVHPLLITFGGRKLAGAVGLLGVWSNVAFVLAFDAVAIVLSFVLVFALKRWKITSRLV
jgi:surface polysaccharide O-acyltransferase-like enzyme